MSLVHFLSQIERENKKKNENEIPAATRLSNAKGFLFLFAFDFSAYQKRNCICSILIQTHTHWIYKRRRNSIRHDEQARKSFIQYIHKKIYRSIENEMIDTHRQMKMV